jgi:serine/threonine protein kinase
VAGLQAAHAKGVVHRDHLKPSNIMVRNEGEAVIMDFGIARSTSAALRSSCTPVSLATGITADTRYDTATRDGAVVGTLQFMAPEQAKAGEVDQRADIYSLGLILYDMLAGRERQNQAESAIDELYERMEHAPQPIHSVVPEVPEALSRLVARCLNPDPALRFHTTAELAVEFDRLDDRGMLGRAHLEDRDFVSADSEFERCVKRRGEALSLFLGQEPTYAYFRPVEEYLARQGIKTELAEPSKLAKATLGS